MLSRAGNNVVNVPNLLSGSYTHNIIACSEADRVNIFFRPQLGGLFSSLDLWVCFIAPILVLKTEWAALPFHLGNLINILGSALSVRAGDKLNRASTLSVASKCML